MTELDGVHGAEVCVQLWANLWHRCRLPASPHANVVASLRSLTGWTSSNRALPLTVFSSGVRRSCCSTACDPRGVERRHPGGVAVVVRLPGASR